MTQRFIDFSFPTADSGTVNRTMPDRLSDYHNVRDFGAVGDGMTDDWEAIRLCYNATTFFVNTNAITGSNLVASFTGVVSSARFTGTISGNNLTTSSPTGTIAIGQTVKNLGGVVACIIVSGSGSSWVVDGSPQAIGPLPMETNNILVASSVSGTIAVNDWLINNGGTDASSSTVYPTWVTNIQGGGVYVLRQYTTNDAGFLETLLQNFTSQPMMTVSKTLNMASTITTTNGLGVYDANNATFCGDGESANGQLSFAVSTPTITINSNISGLVNAGDSIGFQQKTKGVMYFPPGNYYVSKPIDFTAGSPAVVWRGEMGASTLSGNFNDYVLKQTASSSTLTLIERLNIVNAHATGGGIKLGGTNVGVIRDCTITANKGISDYATDAIFNSAYFGAFELTIENCNVSAGSNYSGSFGIAKQSDSPVINCRFIGCERGFITAGGEGAQVLLGCYFEQCSSGIVLNQAPDGGSFACSGIVIAGCWLKNNSIGINIAQSTSQATIIGIRIEGATGQAHGGGDPQYGILTGAMGGFQGSIASAMLAGITVVGQFAVAGIYMAGKNSFNLGPDLVGVADRATSPNPFDLDPFNGNFYLPTQIACSARHIYTVATLPVGNDNGQIINVSDGTNGLNWGDTLIGTGTHTTHYAAQWNNSAWTVIGK